MNSKEFNLLLKEIYTSQIQIYKKTKIEVHPDGVKEVPDECPFCDKPCEEPHCPYTEEEC